jgi:Cu(I)/Ag(I) efflux system membrane protein CusA/SilA
MQVPGARSAIFESLGGEPWPRFEADAAALKRHGVPPELVASTADLVLTGGQVGELNAGGQLYRIRVVPDRDEMDMSYAGVVERLREVTVRSGDGAGQPVPLALLGRPSFVTTPAMVRTERGELVAYVHVDLHHGTDVRSYLRDVQRELDLVCSQGGLRLGSGERVDWTGQYELMAEGEQRLKWIVPLVALSMLVLLFLQFRSLTEALIVLACVPFALVGSIWTLYLCGYPLSAPVWVGLLSTAGLAMQTGVVMVVYIDDAFHRRVREGRLRSREDIVAAHAEGTVQRLRPKIMTITIMAAGLLPLLWADGAGAEIMRRVAAPMLGGLLTSAFLTLEVLPVLYTIWRYRQLQRAQRSGVPLETIVGAVPAWARR